MRRTSVAALAAGVLGALMAGPAQASTIPDMTLRGGQFAVTAGVLDYSLDWAVMDRLQVGWGGVASLIALGSYGRLSYRLLDGTPFGDVGLHAAAGTYSGALAHLTPGQFAFVGPVVARSFGERVVVRASLGLLATNNHNVVLQPGAIYGSATNVVSRNWGLGMGNGMDAVIPNLEVGFRLGDRHEITLGGNAIVGWRGRF